MNEIGGKTSEWFHENDNRSYLQKMIGSLLKMGRMPKHVGFIMDGNRRFAQNRLKNKLEGHVKGFERLADVLNCIENFKRSDEEVKYLLEFAEEKFERLLEEVDELEKLEVKIKFCGKLELLPRSLRKLMKEIELLTENSKKFKLNIMMAYTSRDEMLKGIDNYLEENGKLEMEGKMEEEFSKYLYVENEVDLMIRTSGETRLSDFLLWQCGKTLSMSLYRLDGTTGKETGGLIVKKKKQDEGEQMVKTNHLRKKVEETPSFGDGVNRTHLKRIRKEEERRRYHIEHPKGAPLTKKREKKHRYDRTPRHLLKDVECDLKATKWTEYGTKKSSFDSSVRGWHDMPSQRSVRHYAPSEISTQRAKFDHLHFDHSVRSNFGFDSKSDEDEEEDDYDSANESVDEQENDKIVERNWYGIDECCESRYDYEMSYEKAINKKRVNENIKSKEKVNAKQLQYNQDQDAWETNRLITSGVVKYKEKEDDKLANKEKRMKSFLTSSRDDDINDGSKVNILVSNIVPPFLDGRYIFSKQYEPVIPIRDVTSDMAIMAKKGTCKSVKNWREVKERQATIAKQMEMEGTQMEEITKRSQNTEKSDTNEMEISEEENNLTKEQLDEWKRIRIEQENELVKADEDDEEDDDDDDDGKDVVTKKMKEMKKRYEEKYSKKKRYMNQTYGEFIKDSKTDQEEIDQKEMKEEMLQQRRRLPIYQVKDDIIRLVRETQVLICVGETGSGKTTQLTQYLLNAGFGGEGKISSIIGCTQPRRVAAMSVAKRVAEEMNVQLGQEVGYSIRFEDCCHKKKTVIKYMTDGILLREFLQDRHLSKYSLIIMDEAHERTLNTDLLFGLLKQLTTYRRDIKIIITSATMDAQKFSTFFGDAPIFHIPGRTYPVEIYYSKSVADDYVDASIRQTIQIHLGAPSGDILVFMPGQEDIEATVALIKQRLQALNKAPELKILPIYSQLPSDQQAYIFQRNSNGIRKCIVATNIAETSLTVDGIMYVVDCGYCKMKVYNSRIGMDALQVYPISQANAQQRSGRAGRTGPGQCFRLYTERAFYHEMLSCQVPEIQRTNLSNVVLLLKSLGVENLLEFQFMDSPPQDNLLNSMYQLWILNALSNSGDITQLGKQMIEFPLDPILSKMLIVSSEMKCSVEILTIVSMLSVPSIFYRPKGKEEEADNKREKFQVPESDHLTYLNIYIQWKKHGYSIKWCNEHYIHAKAMKKVREIRIQLKEAMLQSNRYRIVSCVYKWEIVRKCICSAYFHHAARLKSTNEYVNLRTGIPCTLHPTSALYNSISNLSDYIVYHELIMTTREYMQCVTVVDGQWLAELGSLFFTLKVPRSQLMSTTVPPTLKKIRNNLATTISYTDKRDQELMKEAQMEDEMKEKKSSSKIFRKKSATDYGNVIVGPGLNCTSTRRTIFDLNQQSETETSEDNDNEDEEKKSDVTTSKHQFKLPKKPKFSSELQHHRHDRELNEREYNTSIRRKRSGR
ncbi:hypothetical protein SNEBB_010814 [Seison nebaliae]|nr:hypothetical protein SNEBB_010814 [Seison nebaliae]